jgi:hypothetical protein
MFYNEKITILGLFQNTSISAGNWKVEFVVVQSFLQSKLIDSLQPQRKSNQEDETYKKKNLKKQTNETQV